MHSRILSSDITDIDTVTKDSTVVATLGLKIGERFFCVETTIRWQYFYIRAQFSTDSLGIRVIRIPNFRVIFRVDWLQNKSRVSNFLSYFKQSLMGSWIVTVLKSTSAKQRNGLTVSESWGKPHLHCEKILFYVPQSLIMALYIFLFFVTPNNVCPLTVPPNTCASIYQQKSVE